MVSGDYFPYDLVAVVFQNSWVTGRFRELRGFLMFTDAVIQVPQSFPQCIPIQIYLSEDAYGSTSFISRHTYNCGLKFIAETSTNFDEHASVNSKTT